MLVGGCLLDQMDHIMPENLFRTFIQIMHFTCCLSSSLSWNFCHLREKIRKIFTSTEVICNSLDRKKSWDFWIGHYLAISLFSGFQFPNCKWDLVLSLLGFPDRSVGKESTCNAGDPGSIPGLGRSPGERNGYPLQYSGLENSMDCIVHKVKSWRWLSDFHFTFITFKVSPCLMLYAVLSWMLMDLLTVT